MLLRNKGFWSGRVCGTFCTLKSPCSLYVAYQNSAAFHNYSLPTFDGFYYNYNNNDSRTAWQPFIIHAILYYIIQNYLIITLNILFPSTYRLTYRYFCDWYHFLLRTTTPKCATTAVTLGRVLRCKMKMANNCDVNNADEEEESLCFGDVVIVLLQ